MPLCVNPDALRLFFQNNFDQQGVQNNQPNGPGWYSHLDAESQQSVRDTQAQVRAAMNEINNSIGAQNPMPPTGQISAQATSLAKVFSAQHAKQAMQNVARKLYDVYNKILGVQSVAQTNIVLQLSNKLSYLFKNKQAPVEGWLLLDAPMAGRNAGSNEAVQALRSIERTAIGFTRDFNATLFNPFLESIKVQADNLGFASPVEFARMIGDYAIMRHMPEANEYWLSQRQRDIATALQENRLSDASKMQNEVDRFLQYRDWRYQVDPEGKGIRCAGRTDGYARAWIEEFHKMYNIAPAEMEQHARTLTEIVQTLNKWNMDRGNVSASDAQALESSPFQHYVPLRIVQDHARGLPTDSTILNAGSFHARDGMDSRTAIVNAFDSIYAHAHRVAMDNACRDFGIILVAMHDNAIAQGRATPIQVHNYDALTAKAQVTGSFGRRNRAILEGGDGFMMTFMMPEVNSQGQLNVRRKVITFDDAYVDEAQKVYGTTLNDSMKAIQHNTFTKLLSPVTGFVGGLNTHYNVLFAPFNMFRDTGERINNFLGQSYKLEDGTLVGGEKFIGSYVAAIPEVMAFLPKVLRGKVQDLNASPIGRYWQEYVNQGVKQELDPIWHKEGQETDSVLKQWAKDKKMDPVLQIFKGFSDDVLRPVMRAIHGYNDFFNNVSAFAQYYALRKNSVTIDSASTGTLEVINLRESGAYSNALRSVYAFAKPTLQGAASLTRSLGLSPNAAGQFKPSLAGIANFTAQTLVLSMLFNVTKSMLGEEQADNLSMDDVARNILIPYDKEGNTVKLPIPFGVSPLAATFGIGMDRVLRGKMEPLDFVGHMIRQVFKATTPAEFPAYAMSDGIGTYLGAMFTPSVLQPYFQVLTNKGYMGQEITTGDPTSTTPMYMQGRVSTPTGWTTFARLVNEYSGGALNVAPEQVRTMVEGYLGGVTRIIPDLISRNSLASMGFDESTQGILGTAMSTLGASMVYKRIPMTHTQQFYNEYNALKKEIRGYGLKLSEKGAYSDAAGREAVWRAKLEEAGMESNKIDRYLALYQAAQDKAKLTQELKKTTVENENFPDMTHEEIQALFIDYLNQCEELYVAALGA